MESKKSEWFETWFDSPFYHLLYKNRDEVEAHKFLDLLIDKLEIQKGARILDLACGRGRFARYLGSKHFEVLGTDLSPNNISYAKNFERDNLYFQVHDMRQSVEGRKFDYVLNLFTSFGYFSTDNEDMDVLRGVKQNIEDKGTFIIDYINGEKAIEELQENEIRDIDNMRFDIARWVDNGRIYKKIKVNDLEFTEEVKLLNLNKFEEYAAQTGFKIKEVYGNYQLQPYESNYSERMIISLIPS